MPYVADMRKVNSYTQATPRQLVGNGQCVSLIHAVTVIPPASAWRQGTQVKGYKGLLPGSIIATFDSNGRYGNNTNGTSHAAIFLYQSPAGLVVIDQWKGRVSAQDHPPQQRTIYFKHSGQKVDQGDQYYVVQ
jgi:hypothetical protein